MRSVALYGRSGSGKSTVARLLVDHGYQHISTGAACRTVCNEFFGSESKTVMNAVTDAFRMIDSTVWRRAAMRLASPDGRPVVFDSMRFPDDYAYFRQQNFVLVKVSASLDIRTRRLEGRGQEFAPELDDLHDAEASLDGYTFDVYITNSGNEGSLTNQAWKLVEIASDA